VWGVWGGCCAGRGPGNTRLLLRRQVGGGETVCGGTAGGGRLCEAGGANVGEGKKECRCGVAGRREVAGCRWVSQQSRRAVGRLEQSGVVKIVMAACQPICEGRQARWCSSVLVSRRNVPGRVRHAQPRTCRARRASPARMPRVRLRQRRLSLRRFRRLLYKSIRFFNYVFQRP